MSEQNYSIFVRTLKDMYKKNKVATSTIEILYEQKALTLDEYNYIIEEED